MRVRSSFVYLLLLVLLVGVDSRTVSAQSVHVSVQPNPVPVGQSFMISFWVTAGDFTGQGTATVHIRACMACSDIWQSGSMTVGAGLDYEVYPPGISTPGSYIAFVVVNVLLSGGLPGATSGYASFTVSGSSNPFDFSLELSPPSTTVKQGETATFQVLISYSDPSYSGTSISIQVSGLGSGMNFQVIPNPPTLRVSTSSSTPPGSYTITLTGSAKGVKHQAKAQLMVKTAQSFDFSMSASPAQETITPGSSTTSTVTVELLSGTSKSVSLMVSGIPDGASASLSPTSGKPKFKSILSVSTTASVAPGQYALTITGTDGTTSHTTTFTLTIGQAPDFRIDVNPPSQTSTQGDTTTYQISVVGLNGFNSQVTLSVSGLPADANGVFTVTSGTPDFASSLTVTLPPNAPTGTFTLQVTGSGGGQSRAVNLVLNISAATETSTQTRKHTSTQTSSSGGGDLMSVLQQNSILILAAVILLVGAAFVASRRKRPSAPTQAAQAPVARALYYLSCGIQNTAGN